VNAIVLPTITVAGVGVIEMDSSVWTGGCGVTVSVAEPETRETKALMVTGPPAVIPVATPPLLKLAIDELLELHVAFEVTF
jgi:hypothetical protein